MGFVAFLSNWFHSNNQHTTHCPVTAFVTFRQLVKPFRIHLIFWTISIHLDLTNFPLKCEAYKLNWPAGLMTYASHDPGDEMGPASRSVAYVQMECRIIQCLRAKKV